MRLQVEGNAVDLVTSRSEVVETVGLIVLIVAAVLVAGSLIGSGIVLGVLVAAYVMHAALRNI